MTGGIKSDGILEVIKAFLGSGDHNYALWALVIVVGLPSFFKNLPAVLRSVSECVQLHRKTTAKIKSDQQKVERAIQGRQSSKRKKADGHIRS